MGCLVWTAAPESPSLCALTTFPEACLVFSRSRISHSIHLPHSAHADSYHSMADELVAHPSHWAPVTSCHALSSVQGQFSVCGEECVVLC